MDFKAKASHPLSTPKGQSAASDLDQLSYSLLPWGKEPWVQRMGSVQRLQPPRSSVKSFSRKCFVSGQLTQRGGEKIVGTRGHASKEEEFLGAESSPLASHPRLQG